MKNEVEIVSEDAIDITENQVVNHGDRKIIYLKEGQCNIPCFAFRFNEKTIYIPKEMLIRNLRGPTRRVFHIW